MALKSLSIDYEWASEEPLSTKPPLVVRRSAIAKADFLCAEMSASDNSGVTFDLGILV